MQIAISGISGYLGQAINKNLLDEGHDIIGINRELLYGNEPGLITLLENTDVVINLAGAPILQRWTKKNRKTIYESRVNTTRNLTKAINAIPKGKRPIKFISASASGIYSVGKIHNENSKNFDQGFIGKVVQDWEAASTDLPDDVSRTIFRIGVVLGKDSQTIKKMRIPFQLGLGASLGNGGQPFSYIHINDVVKAFSEATIQDNFSGTYNLVAPEIVTNKEFTKIFASTIKRPAFLKIPGFVLKSIFGEAASILLKSPAVIPENLLKHKYTYLYSEIEKALKEIIS